MAHAFSSLLTVVLPQRIPMIDAVIFAITMPSHIPGNPKPKVMPKR